MTKEKKEVSLKNDHMSPADEDILSAALLFEDNIVEKGRIQGRLAGLNKGFYDGEAIGARRGESLGEEIGFYIGFVHTWLSALAKENNIALEQLQIDDVQLARSDIMNRYKELEVKCANDPKSSKIVGGLIQLGQLLLTYPISSPEDHNLQDILSKIRAKFRLCIVRLGLTSYFNQNNESISF